MIPEDDCRPYPAWFPWVFYPALIALAVAALTY
jgi:hypothetical protein